MECCTHLIYYQETVCVCLCVCFPWRWRKYPLGSVESEGREQLRDSVKSEKKGALSFSERNVSFVSISPRSKSGWLKFNKEIPWVCLVSSWLRHPRLPQVIAVYCHYVHTVWRESQETLSKAAVLKIWPSSGSQGWFYLSIMLVTQHSSPCFPL